MMRRLSTLLLYAASACVSAANASDLAVTPASAPVQAGAAQMSSALFAKPVVLRGTLGDAQVQLTVRPKEVADEGLEGSYFVFGRSTNILLAGEMEGDVLFLEESENGTDISGQWDGKLQGETLTGTWTSADGASTRPFKLRAMSPETKTASTRKASAPSTK
ncbi:MAG TPA: hypothetical protein VL528_03230 [Oxalicibacterium sp.]|jgi:hypothetical protein|nr:hypothetical protein [Oxalicibacterium sp.]